VGILGASWHEHAFPEWSKGNRFLRASQRASQLWPAPTVMPIPLLWEPSRPMALTSTICKGMWPSGSKIASEILRKGSVGAPADGSWKASDGNCLRGTRGGSFHEIPKRLRSAYRDGRNPRDRSFDLGFRAAREGLRNWRHSIG